MDRRLRDLDTELEQHRQDPYAHGRMIGRIMQENLTLRESFENRMRGLERFRAQATVLGALGFLLMGALAYAVAARLVGIIH